MLSIKSRAAVIAGLSTIIALMALPAFGADTNSGESTRIVNAVNYGDDEIIIPGVKTGFDSVRANHSTTGKSTAGKSTTGTGRSTTQSTTTSEGTSSSPVVEKIYASVASVTNTTSDDVNTTMSLANVKTLIGQLNTYWNAVSAGAVSVEFGGFETRPLSDSACAPTSVLAQEEDLAFGGKFSDNAWIGTHDHLLVLTQEACSNSSFATVGGQGGEIFSGNGISTSMGMPYLLHEFGHNLGFLHADASICTNTTSYDNSLSSFSFTSKDCPTKEYDDYLDIMGYTVKDATPNLSSVQQILAGWLTSYTTVTKATSVSTITLSALGGSTGTRAVKIIDPVSNEAYYVEYRAPQGRDATSAEFRYSRQCEVAVQGYTTCELDGDATDGIVRILKELPMADQGASGTTVLATGLLSGSTDATKRHTHVNVGQTFSSYDDGFSVTLNSVSISKGASITVSFVHPETTSTSISIDSATQTYATSQPSTAEVSVATQDGTVPTGDFAFYDGSTKISSVTPDADGSASLPLPSTLGVGTHSITARFVPTDDQFATSTSSAAKVTVSKATSTATAKLHSTTVKRGSTEVISVTVSATGVTDPTGTLAVYVNGKKVKSYTLSTSQHGTRTVTLPKFSSKGSKSITVKYLGTTKITSSVSTTMKAMAK